jgi:LPXTG-site transpeptidase (sortase) family protein
MASDDKQKSDQFSASFSLPDDAKNPEGDKNPAADLIRKKVNAAYEHEPSARAEAEEVNDLPAKTHRSKHQQFIYELTNSGRPLHEVQTAWHEYYAGLPDHEKHEVWQEFYNVHAQTAHHPAVSHTAARPELPSSLSRRVHHTLVKPASKYLPRTKTVHEEPHRAHHAPKKKASPLHSVLFGLGVGSITILVFLFGFFNERIIAPFIQPSRNTTNIPIIDTSAAATSNPEIIIPKINVEIPVVYDVNTINEQAIETGLERGVVHYADTASPGQDGNVVIVGHSSNNIFNPGKFKFAFVLLHQLQPGDTFYLIKDGKRYTYQVYTRKVVSPTDVSVLGLTDKPATATLITCDPPGTSNNRLVVTAEQISPDPVANAALASHNTLAQTASIVPGNSPTLWTRIINWFKS